MVTIPQQRRPSPARCARRAATRCGLGLGQRVQEELARLVRIERRQLRHGARGRPAGKNAVDIRGAILDAADQAMYRAKARCRGVTDIRRDDLLEKAV